MIKTVSDLLARFVEEENRYLKDFELNHGPTIGSMYEGLTADVLKKAIPSDLNLNVVSGFVIDKSGQLSPQIDCMLVRGSGQQIPYTNSYKYHIRNVIAVFEVKKTLYSNQFADAYEKLRAIIECYGRSSQSGSSKEEFDITSASRAFSEITGIIAPEYSNSSELPFEQEMLYHTLVVEQVSPVRIALGYDGFKSEYSFRDGLNLFLKDKVSKRGYGVLSFPQLSISGSFSLVKLNGQPYSTTSEQDGWWNCLASTNANPVRLILEFIWTRLARDYSIKGLWGEDLEMEYLRPCFRARVKRQDNATGWEYQYIHLKEETLRSLGSVIEWEPTTVSQDQFVIFNNLCNGKCERITDPELISHLDKCGHNVQDFMKSLISTGMVALNGEMLELTTENCQCAILPDGRYVVGENNSGRFTRWLAKYMAERKIIKTC